jgi:DNA-binding NarL/FixJ family response regulator
MRVAIVEDNPRYRESLEQLFRHTIGYSLAGSFGSAQTLLQRVDRTLQQSAELEWDAVLIDLDLPGMSGIEAIREIKRRKPALPVVVLTVFEEPRTILEAITAGADGYLLKRSSVAELIQKLRGVVEGSAPLTGGVARTILDLLRSQPESEAQPSPSRLNLTEREQDILRGLVRGQSYAQIGESLGISLDTVRTHVRGVYSKLQVRRVSEAVARAIRDRLV